MSIEGFISKNFDVAYQSPQLTSVEEAEIFMLPEMHIDSPQKMNNAKLIDLFVNESILVLVEGVPSMTEVDQKSDDQAFFIKREVRVLGWDRDTVPKMMGFSEELIEEYTEMKEKQAEWYRKAYALMKELKVDSLSDILSVKRTPKAQTLWDESAKLKQETAALSMKVGPKLEEAMDLSKVYDTFQDRNQAMIETLGKTEGTAQRRFVLAGERHLIEEEGESDPRMSVKPLCDYLQTKKVVILKHKEEICAIQ